MSSQITQGFRLSPQQERLWLLQQDNLSYVAQCAFLVEGNIKPELLKAALQQVINRHEILRTRFQRVAGVKIPVMVITDDSFVSWCDINLSDCEPKEQEAKIEDLFQQQKHQNFDFEQGPLLHSSLLKLSVNKFILLVSLPSLCADAWTLKNLVAEISDSYSALLRGEVVYGEVVQYVQFSEWQNQLLEEEDARAGKEYWHQQDLSALNTLTLPFEAKSFKKSEFEPSCVSLALDPNLTRKMDTLVQQYNTSLAVLLLASWQILLWRLTGQSEMIIGIASNGREYEQLYDVLGLFAKWLPIKSTLTAELCFQEVIELTGKAIEDAQEWQDYFIPQSIGNDNALVFPLGFEFERSPEKSQTPGVSFSLYKQYTCIEPFKVKLFCIHHNDSVNAEIHYDVNYFGEDTVQRLAGHFSTLLASAINHPNIPISQLEILQPCDRQQLLVELNKTQIDYPQGKCIHQLFEEQVERTPNNIALVFEDQQLTYAELNTRANQLAHYLQQLGVKPEVLVGLCMERSLFMIVALLGILKAGGAYLPLDSGLPTEGLAFRLQDAQASLVISHTPREANSASTLVNSLGQMTVIYLDTDWDTIAQQSDENPMTEVTSENLAYVMFTSGTQGKPKAVAIEHQQLSNYLNAIADRLNLPASTNFATVSTLAADLGNTVIFPSLCMGGCLHVISSECATDSAALAQYCHKHPIDCLKIVPSHLASLLASVSPETILPRKQLILGGEPVGWDLIKILQQQAPDCLIFNHYGPTEATVGVTTFVVESKQANYNSNTVPLGRPLANTQVYLLDEQLQPVPIGVIGELYIGGASLARGYLNRSELTAERFITNPFAEKRLMASHSGSRLYKTGDLARYLPDAQIEFIGRLDHQVKIRGFRIEIEEIEFVLCQHPQVQQAVASVREDKLGDKRLAAYVVFTQKKALNVSDLRRFLREKLPEYMVPSTFVILNALPLTPNGKVNRSLLPEPDHHRPELEAIYEPPQTEIGQTIATIWQEMLNVEKVGINDNFFELGGHSLLLVQIHSQLKKVFQRDLSITDLFEYPTISSLVKYLNQEQREQFSFEKSQNRAESRIDSRKIRT